MNLFKKKIPLNRLFRGFFDTHFIPLQNEPSPILVGPKLGEEQAFECWKMSLFRSAVFITCIIQKLIITQQEPIEGIKVWILLGYPSNILGYPGKYCNYISNKKLGRFPHSPPPPVDNFLNIHLMKNIIEHKRCGICFRMGHILVLFTQCTNLGIFIFFIFKISDIGIL